MKFAWFPVLSLLTIHAAEAIFKDLFKHHTEEDKPSILGILTKPKIPGISIQLGSPSGAGSFGFGFGIGLPSVGGAYKPPIEAVHVKPGFQWEDRKEHVGRPRPNWGDGKDGHPRPGSHDYGKDGHPRPGSHDYGKDGHPKPGSHDYGKDDYPKPGPYDDVDYSRPGGYDEDKDYSNPDSLKDGKDYPKPDRKDPLPDWEDIGEKHSESMMEGDLVGGGLIQPRLNRRRNKRYIESRVYHVPILFRSNAKPYQVKISSHPNGLTKANEVA